MPTLSGHICVVDDFRLNCSWAVSILNIAHPRDRQLIDESILVKRQTDPSGFTRIVCPHYHRVWAPRKAGYGGFNDLPDEVVIECALFFRLKRTVGFQKQLVWIVISTR